MIADQSLTLAVLALRSVVAATLKFGKWFVQASIIFLKLAGSMSRDVLVQPLDLEAEAGGEVLLVADHHVDVLGDLAVDLLRALPCRPGSSTARRGSSGRRRRRCRTCAPTSTASITASAVLDASAAKMPPVWNQRTPSSPNSFSQFTSPGRICEAAEWPRSEQPSAGADAEALLGEVQADAGVAADAVEVAPDQVRRCRRRPAS